MDSLRACLGFGANRERDKMEAYQGAAPSSRFIPNNSRPHVDDTCRSSLVVTLSLHRLQSVMHSPLPRGKPKHIVTLQAQCISTPASQEHRNFRFNNSPRLSSVKSPSWSQLHSLKTPGLLAWRVSAPIIERRLLLLSRQEEFGIKATHRQKDLTLFSSVSPVAGPITLYPSTLIPTKSSYHNGTLVVLDPSRAHHLHLWILPCLDFLSFFFASYQLSII